MTNYVTRRKPAHVTPELLVQRFWMWTRVREGECWEWVGTKDRGGYGGMRGPRGSHPRYLIAHRFSWELHNGKIPDGMLVLHRCDNPGCVNPDHLFLGTHKDNSDDKIRKGRDYHPPSHMGEATPSAKLTEQQVMEIRRRYAAGGVRQIDLANEFGVRDSTISRIVTGADWKHLEPINERDLRPTSAPQYESQVPLETRQSAMDLLTGGKVRLA